MILQRTRRLGTCLLVGGALACVAPIGKAQAQNMAMRPSRAQSLIGQVQLEPWPGKRVVMMLPLQLGEGWNANRELGNIVLPVAEQELQNALEATGKFSVTQPHRFNPLLRRAVQEGKLTDEMVIQVAASPTLENAREVLSKFDFDQTPMVAQFFLEEVLSTRVKNRQSVTVQVTGRLYELDGPAVSNILLTSDPVTAGRTSYDQVLLAADDAFMRIAQQFVQPISDFALPSAMSQSAPAMATSPSPSLTGKPGGVLAPGMMPQLPPAQPPLGVASPADDDDA